MAEQHHIHEEVVQNGDYVARRRETEIAPPTGQVILARVRQLIWLLAGILVTLLAFRFVLALVNASRGSAFADFIYNITDVFVAPFVGITGNPSFGQGSIIDMASLFAMVVYPLIAWAVIRLLYILFKAPGGIREVSTYQRR